MQHRCYPAICPIEERDETMRSMMLACASMLLASGCIAKPASTYHVMVDNDFSNDQATAVLNALANWETALDGRLHFDIEVGNCTASEFGHEHEICVHSAKETFIEAMADSDDVIGNTKRLANDSSDVFLPYDFTGDVATFETIATHELGHSMGLVHHHGVPTVMCWALQCAAPKVETDDCNQWTSIRGEFEVSCQ